MASLSGDSSSMFQNRLSSTPELYIEVRFCGGSLLRAATACAFSATTLYVANRSVTMNVRFGGEAVPT